MVVTDFQYIWLEGCDNINLDDRKTTIKNFSYMTDYDKQNLYLGFLITCPNVVIHRCRNYDQIFIFINIFGLVK